MSHRRVQKLSFTRQTGDILECFPSGQYAPDRRRHSGNPACTASIPSRNRPDVSGFKRPSLCVAGVTSRRGSILCGFIKLASSRQSTDVRRYQVRGASTVGAMFLINMPPDQAFVAMRNILERHCMRSFYGGTGASDDVSWNI